MARVEAEECSATFVQTMRAKVRRHFRKANSLPLCERTFRSMHRYSDLSALAAVLSWRTLTHRRIAPSLKRPSVQTPPRPTLGLKSRRTSADRSGRANPQGSGGGRRRTEAKLSCGATVSVNAGAEKRILILGGGFAGAYAALHLEKRLGRAPGVEGC